MLRRGKTGGLDIVSRLDLPGEGDVSLITNQTGELLPSSNVQILNSPRYLYPAFDYGGHDSLYRHFAQYCSAPAPNCAIPFAPAAFRLSR
jgi:hypothetical protein